MITGCTTVSKHTIERHFSDSEDHKRCIQRQQVLLPCERLIGVKCASNTSQPKVNEVLNDATIQATKRLVQTAYLLAKTPTMPLSHFKLMCMAQSKNGLNLLNSKFLYYIILQFYQYSLLFSETLYLLGLLKAEKIFS